MNQILLMEMPSWPNVVIGCLMGLFTVLKGIELYQGKSRQKLKDDAKHWETAAVANAVELQTQREAANRLRGENKDLITEVSSLKVRTDLRPLFDAVTGWVVESRDRFSKAMEGLSTNHIEQSEGLKALLLEIGAQRMTSEVAFRTLSQAFLEFQVNDSNHKERILQMMDNMERRLSDVGVKIGVVQWSTPQEFEQTGQLAQRPPSHEARQEESKKADGGSKSTQR